MSPTSAATGTGTGAGAGAGAGGGNNFMLSALAVMRGGHSRNLAQRSQEHMLMAMAGRMDKMEASMAANMDALLAMMATLTGTPRPTAGPAHQAPRLVAPAAGPGPGAGHVEISMGVAPAATGGGQGGSEGSFVQRARSSVRSPTTATPGSAAQQ